MSQVTREDNTEQSGWAIGGIVFAASAMLIIGCWQAIMGLAAIIDDDFYVVPRTTPSTSTPRRGDGST